MVVVALEPDLLDDVRRPVLQLDRLPLQDLEVGPFLARLLQVFLEPRDLLLEGLALLAALAEDVLDAPHLLGVGEPLLEGDRFDAFKGTHASAFHVLHQRSGRLPPVGAAVVILVAVLLFAGVRGALHRHQEDVHQEIVEVEILVGDEAEEVKMAIRVRPS